MRWQRWQALRFEPRVRAPHGPRPGLLLAVHHGCWLAEHAAAEVVWTQATTPRRRKDVGRLWRVLVAPTDCDELVAQRAADLHPAATSIRLALADVQPAAREIYVTPAQRQQLPDPQPGEDQRRDHRAALDVLRLLLRLAVPLCGRIQQRGDLHGGSGRTARERVP